MDDPPLASLSLTHVNYNAADPLSYASAYLALIPQGLVIIYVSVIWSTREIEILLMFAGQMACEGLNWILKRMIKEQRPTQMLGKGYGMPSSHAQFVAYFSTFLTLFMLFRYDPHNHLHGSKTHTPIPLWQRLLLAVAAFVCAGAVAQSRIYLNYHHPRQVYAGIAAGATCAVLWFGITGIARHLGVIAWLLDLPMARWARLRDLVLYEDLVDAGWARWEERRWKGNYLVGADGKINNRKKVR